MHQVQHIRELRAQIDEWKQQRLKIAFVPTMGNLHDGHLSLIDLARQQADKLVSSIFVNPMQFDQDEDLQNYPRSLEQDCKELMEHACDLVYLPDTQTLYPHGLDDITVVDVVSINQDFEGAFRPGHLQGVSTIVLKLFNLIQPDIAVFGKKDYQQWRMIEKMVRDLNLAIDIIGGETVREADGLAMSSRNRYLDPTERSLAAHLNQQLARIVVAVRDGADDFHSLCEQARSQLEDEGFSVNYLDICHRETLDLARYGDPMVVIAAARLGTTRLIDNMEI